MALVIIGVMFFGALRQRNVKILTTRLSNVKKISPPTPGFDLFGIDIFKSGIVTVLHASLFGYTKLTL